MKPCPVYPCPCLCHRPDSHSHVSTCRRVAERRMGLEANNFVHGHGPYDPDRATRAIYQVNDHGSFQYDRRVSDRRVSF